MIERAKQARYDFATRHERARDRHFMRVWLGCTFGPMIPFCVFGGMSLPFTGTTIGDFLMLAALAIIPFIFFGCFAGIFIATASARARFGPMYGLFNDRCPKCGYDLSGGMSHLCSECGSKIADAPDELMAASTAKSSRDLSAPG